MQFWSHLQLSETNLIIFKLNKIRRNYFQHLLHSLDFHCHWTIKVHQTFVRLRFSEPKRQEINSKQWQSVSFGHFYFCQRINYRPINYNHFERSKNWNVELRKCGESRNERNREICVMKCDGSKWNLSGAQHQNERLQKCIKKFVS